MKLLMVWIAVALTVLPCCSDESSRPHSAIEQAWAMAGADVKLSNDKSSAIAGGDCRSGLVAGFHVDLCVFKDAVSADAAREAGLERVGSHTGACLIRDRFLFVIADRDNVDPHGKRLNEIAQIFLKSGES